MANDGADKKEGTNPEGGAEGSKASGGVHGILFAPDIPVWNESRRLAADKSIRVDDLAICAAQDPAIVVELIKTANALYFAVGKSPITSVKNSIVRLGSDVVIELLEKMKERQSIEDAEIADVFEVHRRG